MDAIVVLRDELLQIIECLDQLSLGIGGQTMGMDMEHPPAVSLSIADQVLTVTNILWAPFEAPQEGRIPLCPTVQWEKDPNSS